MIFNYARSSGMAISVEADAMDVSENGDLMFWVMSPQGDSSVMVQAIAAGQWMKAWIALSDVVLVSEATSGSGGDCGAYDKEGTPVYPEKGESDVESPQYRETLNKAREWLVDTFFPRIPR